MDTGRVTAGIPDLQGTIGFISSTSHSDVRATGCTGVFRWLAYSPVAQIVSPGTTAANTYDVEMYASRGSLIYGRSHTVTPLSLQNKFFLKF